VKHVRVALLKRDFSLSGGLEKYTTKIYEALSAKGHTVSILSSGRSSLAGVISVSPKIIPSFLSMVCFDVCSRFWLRKNPQDIVLGMDRHFLPLTHYRAGNGCHAAFLERRKREAPWWKKTFLFLNPLHALTLLSEKRTVLSPTTTIICNSHLVRNEMLRFYPKADPKRIVVVHNGVEWEVMESQFIEKKDLLVPHILFVGHEWERKGLDRILKALSLIKEKKFSFTAVGKERRPEYFERMKDQLDLSHSVSLIPKAQKTIPLYQAASIMVIPSRYDPFANVTLEALAMGLYVITTKANGGGEVITAENGVVLEEEASAEDFAKALCDAFEKIQDPSLPRRIRDSVKKHDFSYRLEELVFVLTQGSRQMRDRIVDANC
jgi:UDP-glucose:(heptosyl)LPS alpha-1,3-glucosyltransferase